MSGSRLKLESTKVKCICETYDAYFEDFEKILLIEKIAYPLMLQNDKLESDRKKADANRNKSICPV